MARAFEFSEEHDMLRDGVRRFLDAQSPSTEVRRLMETTDGFDAVVWKQMAGELALPGLAIPEEYGGQGYGFVELAIVMEEMGRALLCAPYLASVLASRAILNVADAAQCAELLPRIAAGDAIATLAVTEPSGRWDASGVTLDAQESDGGWTLRGTKSFVLDGMIADTIVTIARLPGTTGDDGICAFVVDGNGPGLTRTPLEPLDPTRKLAQLDFAAAPARLLGEAGAAGAALSKTLDEAVVCLVNEMVGGAQKVLDMSVEYAKTRVQFGRAIGSFQAIKHRCADLLVEVEAAKSAAYYAAWTASVESDEAPFAACLAKAHCSDVYFRAAAETIQIHGGIGFTWEHDAHLYFKRAKSSELLFGDGQYHRELLARRMGLGAQG